MKRTPLARKTPIKRKRATPRRRPAPRWDSEQWGQGNLILMARAGYVCERCGHAENLERHHRKRRRDGGESFQNLTALCSSCHAWAHQHPALARRYGFIVAVTSDPLTVPMLWRSHEWVYLSPDGSKHPLGEELTDAHGA